MESISKEKAVLRNYIIIFLLVIFIGYFFSQVHLFEQRAVDAGLVLANIVNYPDEISPMKEYFIKSWTSLHQISKIFLSLNWTFSNVSKLIIFLTALLYFVGIFLTIKSSTKSTLISILAAAAILILQKNLGDTDYPSLVFSEHTYGMVSLAVVTFIFGLLFSGNLFLAGFFSALLISIHPLIGIWISGMIMIALFLKKYFIKTTINNNKLISGYAIGIIFTLISFIYYFVLTADFTSFFDPESYNNYMKYWEGHRNDTNIHIEYLLKTLLVLIFCFLGLMTFNKNFSDQFKFGILCVLTSIIASIILYFLYKFFLPNIPDFLVRLMPGRFTILHSIIGWPIILGILFVIVKQFENKFFVPNKFGHILILFIIISYSISHYKVFVRLGNLFVNNVIEKNIIQYDKKFWSTVKNIEFDGYILTNFSSSTISMRETFKPILLDVSSLDFVPYFPNTAKNMSLIIEEIYGIDFDNPPANIKNKPFLADESIKNNFENYSNAEWKILSKKFNFNAIIIPVDWNMKLSPKIKGEIFALYIL